MDLATLINDSAEQLNLDVVPRYSGRNMYGRDCLGVTCDSISDLMADVILNMSATVTAAAVRGAANEESTELAAAEADFEENIKKLLSYKTDNMGFNTIYYWPEIDGSTLCKYIEPEEDEDESDNDTESDQTAPSDE